jgi:hypothetical protein
MNYQLREAYSKIMELEVEVYKLKKEKMILSGIYTVIILLLIIVLWKLAGYLK